MYTKIDWLSFSVLIGESTERGLNETASSAWNAVEDLEEGLTALLGMDTPPVMGKGRAPYSHSYSWHNNGLTLFVHPALPHALVEVSGKGCEAILTGDWAWNILRPIMTRLTRLDVACDMLTETRPIAFTAQRDENRFKARSETVSESGETVYIGSRSSNRYARVYRYNPPHERSHLLRCEFVVKAEDSKLTAQAIINDGLDSVAAALGTQFGWLHPDWIVASPEPAELKTWRPERREGKTTFWLEDTIKPLLIRLHREGTINLWEWVNHNLLDVCDDDIPF